MERIRVNTRLAAIKTDEYEKKLVELEGLLSTIKIVDKETIG